MHRPERSPEHAIPEDLASRFRRTRALSEALVETLSDADATVQSMEDASPAKWHLAHTTWFWETFLLRDHMPGYTLWRQDWPFLFNSYYEAEGERLARTSRGLLSRPTLEDLLEWRAHVTEAMAGLADDPSLASLVELGIAHEQQHQELLLTDIKHALFHNPLGPAMWPSAGSGAAPIGAGGGWHNHPGGIARIGHGGDSFAFDNEGPQHRVLLDPFALAERLVTNCEWQAFIDDGGYGNAALWLSDGWAWVQSEGISAPLYWREDALFTHTGWESRIPSAPVTHISFYEADAFATWAGARLPTEFEWETVAQGADPASGNQLDRAAPPVPRGGGELFGDCWQFTRSAYLPYPRFSPAEGAVGEYNGKFMSGQVVLRGASCATVRGHSRSSYRNFFYPNQRWQFTGLRLAKDA
ncbi:ergothioneine biosynthesis protein EgtB [Tsuneonella sp. HG094]